MASALENRRIGRHRRNGREADIGVASHLRPLFTHGTHCPFPPDTTRTPTISTHNFLARPGLSVLGI